MNEVLPVTGHHGKARKLFEARRFEDVIKELEPLASDGRLDSEGAVLLGVSFLRSGRIVEANSLLAGVDPKALAECLIASEPPVPEGTPEGRTKAEPQLAPPGTAPKGPAAPRPDRSWQSWHERIMEKLRDRDFDAACAMARAGARAVGPESAGVARLAIARCLDLAGRPKEAIHFYQSGLELVPPSQKLFLKAGTCAARAGIYGLADRYLTIAGLFGARGWNLYFFKGVAECRLRRWPHAFNSFTAALARRPDDILTIAHMAYVELQLNRAHASLERLSQIRDEITEWPEAWLWLVQAQRRCGLQEEALNEARLLHDCYPDFRPALLTLGELSVLNGDYNGALIAYERSLVVEEAPANPTAITLAEGSTLTTDDVKKRVDQCRNVLEQGLGGEPGAALVRSHMMDTPIPPAFQPRFPLGPARRIASDRDAFASHIRTVHALLLREVRSRFARNKLGYIWALIDPALQVLVFYLIFAAMGQHDRAGMSLILFLTTGVIPFSFLQNTFANTVNAVDANKPLLSHPNVKVFDVISARVLLQFPTSFVVFAIFILAAWGMGEQVRINDPAEVVYCLVLLTVAGMGFGLAINAFSTLMRSLPMLFGQVMRILFFSSGIFFTVSDLPRSLRQYVLYNPFVHLIDTVRFNFNHQRALADVNLSYPTIMIMGFLFIGLISHLALRKRIFEQ